MPQITLAKALKLKNRLAGRLSKVNVDIQMHNSRLAEQPQIVSVSQAYERRRNIVDSLVALKSAVVRANSPIQEALIRQGELRAEIEFLGNIHVMDGVQKHSYQGGDIHYVAQLKKENIDTLTSNLEKQIDAIQDQIDEHNHATKIEVSQLALDLAS
jgi:hypothetical protein